MVFQWHMIWELVSGITLVFQVSNSSGTGGMPVAHKMGVSQWNNIGISSY